MKRFLLIPLVGIIAALGLGSAAALGTITSPNIAAADADVDSCDPNGVTVSYSTQFVDATGYVVNSITIGDVHANCAGDDLSLTLTTGLGVFLQTETAIAASPSTVVTVAPVVPVVDIDGIHIMIQD